MCKCNLWLTGWWCIAHNPILFHTLVISCLAGRYTEWDIKCLQLIILKRQDEIKGSIYKEEDETHYNFCHSKWGNMKLLSIFLIFSMNYKDLYEVI